MSPQNYWSLWLGGFFLVYELYQAKWGKPGGTLSETTWDWLGTYKAKREHFVLVRRVIFGAFWIALGLHFEWHASYVWVAVFGGLFGLAIVFDRLGWFDAKAQ